jgi:hypothetical protein
VKVHQAYRFALDPTVQQRQALASHCGAARFAFNFGLRLVKQTLSAREWERRLLGGALTESLSWTLPALRREWNRQGRPGARRLDRRSSAACLKCPLLRNGDGRKDRSRAARRPAA